MMGAVTRDDDARAAWRQTTRWAGVGQGLVIGWMVVGVLAGAGLVFTPAEGEEWSRVWAGLGVALGAVTIGVCVHAVLSYVCWRALREPPGDESSSSSM